MCQLLNLSWSINRCDPDRSENGAIIAAGVRQLAYVQHQLGHDQEGQLMKLSSTIRRLARTIFFAAARGAGTVVGSTLISVALWWITQH